MAYDFFGFDQRTKAKKTRQSLTYAMKKALKEAVGYRCEICKKKYPERNLKVHHINETHNADNSKNDLNTPGNLLIICLNCHDDVRHKLFTKTDQKKVVQKRSAGAKKKIFSALRKMTKVYSGPNDDNLFDFGF
ncbi:putative restriction endonuclease [Methanomicrobium sp. W14]|uniref:HNH endonuclease n=1 Tax=Methanomicrobium sp. W14 TaxID=2817839 RepID=UPI001AE10AF6|nr:HNH endonuclease [Methanomicrobium sp. W14]MBP2132470.1 putative restriction endonuclease [Methanomicrobium sp. W14]